MASIFKFSGYMVAPNDEIDAKEFMDGLIEFAEMNDMYEGPLVTEARKFEWDDDLLINDTECPDEVFEMYFDGTIKTYDDFEKNEFEEDEEEIDCEKCECRDECDMYHCDDSDDSDSEDDDDVTIYITIYDGIDDEEDEDQEKQVELKRASDKDVDHLVNLYLDNMNKYNKHSILTADKLLDNESEFCRGIMLSDKEIALLKNKMNDFKINETKKDAISLLSALEMLLADE